ncbi:Hexose carrier protein HEX6 [Linum grandiflorum]
MSAILTGSIRILTTFLSMLIVDMIRRQKLFLIGGIQMLVSPILVGAIMTAELGDHGGIGK